jgi:hypothetical protein
VSKKKIHKTVVGTKSDVTTETKAKGSAGDRVGDALDLPVVDEDIILTGAAADATDLEEKFKGLPRILRIALLIDQGRSDVHDRLVADVVTLRPGLPLTAVFAASGDHATALALANDLDRCAVADDEPELRHIADCIRLVSIPMQQDLAGSEDYKRVTLTLMNAVARLPDDIDPQLGADIETFCVGWAMIPAMTHRLPRYQQSGQIVATHASFVGSLTAKRRVEAAEGAAWARIEAQAARQKAEVEDAVDQPTSKRFAPPLAPGQHQCVVAQLSEKEMQGSRLKELIPQFKDVINVAVPLVVSPNLAEMRKALLFEFPHAQSVIDTVLADLIGRPTVLVRPTLMVGEPGGGKSTFVRRLAELLGVLCWRTDASRIDSSVFAGTDRRWNSAEPCHPFLAIARARHANPMILLDELEKAGTRSEYGRFWDSLLGFLEPETSIRYPDPVLTNLNLSNISYLATANSLAGLPRPLLDRMRVVDFPLASRDHLDALLPAVIADLARERGLDASWVVPLDGDEHAAVASAWNGGSVRILRRLVEIILRDRDANATRN